MRGEPGNLVSKPLGGDDRDILRDALVRGEIESQARVVLLDDDARGLWVDRVSMVARGVERRSDFLMSETLDDAARVMASCRAVLAGRRRLHHRKQLA